MDKSNVSTARGFIWFFFNNVFAKSLTFISQFVLGWLLLPSDFGLYAIVVSIGIFIGMLSNGGIEKILIQRGDELSEILPTATIYGFIFNILGMTLFFITASTISELYDDERLYYMLIIMGLVLPMGTLAALYRAKLSIDCRYKQLAVMKTSGASSRQIMIVVFALNGLGVYSFVIPMIIEVIVESIVGLYFTRWVPCLKGFSLAKAKDLFGSCKWLMLASVMLGLASTGDFFLLGLFLTKEKLGIYFFGLQLVLSISTIFSMAIQGVILPALVQMKNDSSKFGNLFSETISRIFFVSMPFAILISVSARPLIHWIWNGKWDEAIQIVQIMSIGMPFWLMVFIARSGLEALGLWRKMLMYVGVYGFSSMLIAASLAQTKEIIEIAIGVAAIRGIIGIVQAFSIYHLINEKYKRVVLQVVLIIVISVISVFIAFTCIWLTSIDLSILNNLAVSDAVSDAISFKVSNLRLLIAFVLVFTTIFLSTVKLCQPQHLKIFHKMKKK